MDQTTGQLISIVFYFVAMLAIGWWGYKKTSNYDDYMLGGRALHPIPAALSAGASDMSGWLLMGLPGAMYASGLIESWIAVGLLIGAWVNWKVVAPRLRSYTHVSSNSITLPSFFNSRLAGSGRALTIVSGIIILVFFTFYVSSSLVAAGKYFEAAFGWDYVWGMLLIAGIVVLYTFVGGFLAVAWTDMAQGFLMMIALVAVPIVAFTQEGPSNVFDDIKNTNADLIDPFAGMTIFVVLSAIGWGLGYFGQPHIIVRFMALRSPADADYGRRIGIGWMLISIVGTAFVSIVGMSMFNAETNPLEDPEYVFISLAQVLFHPLIGGLILAAVLAAIMSTVSSQLLVSSSALVEDIYAMVSKKEMSSTTSVMLGRVAVILTAVLAAVLSITPSDTILNLVGFAWAGFGSAFGPIILLSLYWKKLTATGALSGMVTGAVVVAIWGNISDGPGGIFNVYEMIPGFLLALIVTIVVSKLTPYDEATQAHIEEEFDHAVELADEWDHHRAERVAKKGATARTTED